ncbi:MAG: citrate (Si)-synthase [Phycisphaerae bacterium]|nr:citrate (Si)-synthase [Phycisphaerae bacterium]
MAKLKDVFANKLPQFQNEIKGLVTKYGDKAISEVTVTQAYGGMRGVKAQVCDTSTVSPETGLIVRGIPLEKITDRCPEEMFWLLLTGELPDADSLKGLQADLAGRADVPDYVFDVLRALPKDTHPMAMQSIALVALQRGSKFRKRYDEGMRKQEYWEACLEDSLDLLAKMPALTAGVYRIRYEDGKLIPRDPNKDWSANFAHMMGVPDPTGRLADLMRLYLNLHADHESGNVSANLCHVCGSALSDPYYSVAAGLNGLAGPLHGLANQECLKFHLALHEKFNGVPTAEQLKEYAWETLNSGRVIPGFGHAVLRCTDPRYTACHEFGLKACPDEPLFKLADIMLQVVPGVLKEHGKAKNTNPNVDALSGVLMYAFGVKQPPFYTAIFGVSRAVGMCSQMILNRAIGTPITRPKSVTTEWIKQQVGG